MVWRDGELTLTQWYDLAKRVGQEIDERSEQQISEEYMALLEESVRLRFRSDVPVGINLSGGLDSSTLLGLVQKFQGEESGVRLLPLSQATPGMMNYPGLRRCCPKRITLLSLLLSSDEVPALAESFRSTRTNHLGPSDARLRSPLRDRAERGNHCSAYGQGMDEQWLGMTITPTRRPASLQACAGIA